jgi:hypothetical protein
METERSLARGSSKGAESQNSKVHSPDLNVPRLERKYVLMYLLDQVGMLTRGQVDQLAEQLYQRSQRREPPIPIRETCHSAGIATTNGFDKDVFVNSVALDYGQLEMEQEYSLRPLEEGPVAPGLIDTLAGSGPPRPLLKELYSLAGLGVVSVDREANTPEMFRLTHRGTAAAKALNVIFDALQPDLKKRNFLVIVGPNSTTLAQHRQEFKAHQPHKAALGKQG